MAAHAPPGSRAAEHADERAVATATFRRRIVFWEWYSLGATFCGASRAGVEDVERWTLRPWEASRRREVGERVPNARKHMRDPR